MRGFAVGFLLLISMAADVAANPLVLVQEPNGYHHLSSDAFFFEHEELELERLFVPYYSIYHGRSEGWVRYSHPAEPLEIEIAVYRPPAGLDELFELSVHQLEDDLRGRLLRRGSRERVTSPSGVDGYALELRHRGRLRGESQVSVLATRIELYETKGWCVDVRTTATHDGSFRAQALAAEVLQETRWPRRIRSLPIERVPLSHELVFEGTKYRSRFWGDYRPLVKVLQEDERLSYDTLEVLELYEWRSRRQLRSLGLAAICIDVIPLASLGIVLGLDANADSFGDWSAGSYLAAGVGVASLLYGFRLIVDVFVHDPGDPYEVFGRVNADLIDSGR